MALKLVLNATYGAFANKYFVLSNSKIANAITAMGRDLIRYMVVCSENYFYKEWITDIERQKLLGMEYIAKSKTDGKYYFLNKEYNNPLQIVEPSGLVPRLSPFVHLVENKRKCCKIVN